MAELFVLASTQNAYLHELEAERDRLRSNLAASFAAGLKIEQRARECEARVAELEELLRDFLEATPECAWTKEARAALAKERE